MYTIRHLTGQPRSNSRLFRKLVLLSTGSAAITAYSYYYYPEIKNKLNDYIFPVITEDIKIISVETPKTVNVSEEIRQDIVLSADYVKNSLNELASRVTQSLDLAFDQFDRYYAYLVDLSYGRASSTDIPGYKEILNSRRLCRSAIEELDGLLVTGHHRKRVMKLKKYISDRLKSLDELYDPEKLVDKFRVDLKKAKDIFKVDDDSPIAQVVLVNAHHQLSHLAEEIARQKAFKELIIENEIQKRVKFILDVDRMAITKQISDELARESQILLDEQLDEQAARLSDQYASL